MQIQDNKTITAAIDRLAEAIEQQNQLLNDIIKYPQDLTQPPRVLIENISETTGQRPDS